MSTLVDPEYSPASTGKEEFLSLIPNIFNPAKPLPLNLTPEETLHVYDVLCSMREQKALEKEEEERALYSGSVNLIPPDL